MSKNISLKTTINENFDLVVDHLEDEIESDVSLKHSINIISKYFDNDVEEMFINEVNDIKSLLKRDIIWIFGGLEKRINLLFENDPSIKKALEIFNNENEYFSKLNINSTIR